MGKILMATWLSLVMASTALSAAEPADTVTLEQMEHHWQQVISEADPEKRRLLLEEHRKMMEQMQSMHGMGMGGNHRMMHGMDMHRTMMDMMSE